MRLTISLTLAIVTSLIMFIEGVRPQLHITESAIYFEDMWELPQTAATPEPVQVKIPQRDLKCLAENIYHEARGEGINGMLAVANVTLNRVATTGFPSTVCGVVYQPYQFSWTLIRDQIGIYEKAAYEQSLAIAKYALTTAEDITGGALFFHSITIKRPKWTKGYEEALVLNNHIFYKGKSNEKSY